MKEFSIEEKAKAYDELLVKAKHVYNKENDVLIIHTIEDFFPELKKSEDERIRKELIEFVKSRGGFKQEYITWLEKQGKQKPNYCHHEVDLSSCSEEYRKAYYDGWNNCNMQHSQCESEKSDVLKCLINGMKFYYEDNEEATWGTEKFSMKVKDILSWLEKQGDKKPYGQRQECLDCQFNYAGECKGSCAMKRGEQKPNPYSGTTFEYNGHIWGMCARDNGVEILFDGELKAFLSLEKSFIYPIHPQPSIMPKSTQETINGTKVEPKFKVGDYIKHNKANIICKIISINGGSYYVENIGTNGGTELFNAEQNFHLWTIQDAKDGDVLVTCFEEDNMILMYHSMCTIDTINVHCCLDNKFTRANLGIFDVEDVKPATKEQRDLLFEKMKEAGYEWDAEKKELKKIIDEKQIKKNLQDNSFRRMFEQKPADSYCQENCKGFQETGKCFADGDCKAKREADSTNEVEPKFKVGDKIYLKPEYRMPNDDTPIANTVKEIIRIDDKHYRFDGAYIFIKDQDKYELVEQKPEWSEEDEEFLRRAINAAKDAYPMTANWLKSLRPNNNWKPSDEQMEVLLSEVTAWTKGCPKQIVLESLYEDLKKLKLIKEV